MGDTQLELVSWEPAPPRKRAREAKREEPRTSKREETRTSIREEPHTGSRENRHVSKREERSEGGRRGRTETRKEEPTRRGDQRPTNPQVEEPQPTPTENAVKEPQATQADIAENNAAAEARRLAEWHRRIALAAAKEELRQRRVWEDALALAKRLKATQEAEKAPQEAEAERHKRDVAHQWRCVLRINAAEQREMARLRAETEEARATRTEGAADGLAVISSDEEEAECPPAPKAA
ncbi:GL19749 [Drosophila persimilis]|uniref:GL19749 n=1 Tax=Drosophila persimilis TaxID=7234 RepID=B4HCV2_DROPE|nr:GL19749 [Drosophila persimilis]